MTQDNDPSHLNQCLQNKTEIFYLKVSTDWILNGIKSVIYTLKKYNLPGSARYTDVKRLNLRLIISMIITKNASVAK